jgi:ketosteroid isomerase-like protein
MSSRYLFRKSTMPWYMHRRWLLFTMVVPMIVMSLGWSNEQPREEWVWQSPIEPPGVTIVSHAVEADVKRLDKRSAKVTDSGVVRLATATSPSTAQGLVQDETEVRQAIERWSAAWSARDMKGYLDLYAKSFAPAGGQSRSDWVKSRYQRILSKKHISHGVQNLDIQVTGDAATANFQQTYEADTSRQVGPKTLHLIREGGHWRIRLESTL